jgi:hypothetical protein
MAKERLLRLFEVVMAGCQGLQVWALDLSREDLSRI